MLKKLILGGYRVLTRILPVNRKIILFESNLGRNYSGNPRAIYEELLRLKLDRKYRCYFILEDIKTKIPGSVRKVKKNRIRYFLLFAISGIWISDSRFPRYIIKRKSTTYIQTWHGTPLKKLAMDMETVFMAGETGIEDYKKNFCNNSKTWDYLISQNNFSSNIFRRAFAYQKEILEIGYPRNDVLFSKNNDKDILTLKKKLGLPLDKKVILYAPTWRDNEFYGNGRYKFNPKIDYSLLQEEFGKDCVMIVKYHYLIMDKVDWSPYKGFIYSCDMSYDIATLYLVSDMLITDYSSAMFDYSILKRPMLFYCYDLEEYKNNLRGFYFDFLAEAPGPVVKNTRELVDAIRHYDGSVYEDKYHRFVDKYNYKDDGTASLKVVKLIEDIIKNK